MSATTEARPRRDRPEPPFEPVIIGFTCNWCSYRAADLAGTARDQVPAERAPHPAHVLRPARPDVRAQGVRSRAPTR